jgi:hypothetical protein
MGDRDGHFLEATFLIAGSYAENAGDAPRQLTYKWHTITLRHGYINCSIDR